MKTEKEQAKAERQTREECSRSQRRGLRMRLELVNY